ncbi:MAG: imidazolonepropionase, partial [Acidobacteriota bacterium]|nr:imidazolonepropionase [Acidobacteriota bacterium]
LAGAETERFDARGGALVPGFVDPHTHLPWAGSRAGEFAERLAGRSYQDIAAAGGGILSTVRATRQAGGDELTANVTRRLDRMLAWGTTTAEAKSGYGLALEPERKQLEALAAAAAAHPVEVVPTLLAAHETPPELRGDTDRYVELVCSEIVPAIARAGLAAYCDVFCETGVFSVSQSRRVLAAGAAHGLAARLHADEFVDSGGAELAAEIGAVTADHLMAVSPRGIDALAASGVIAGLLPGTSFFLKKKAYAPARRLIEAGVPVTLATDCNPGSSHTESMPMVFWLAVLELDMSVGEALTAMTLNAACSLGRGAELGSIEVGKQADLVVLEGAGLDDLAYHFGVHPISAVIKRGAVAFRKSPRACG